MISSNHRWRAEVARRRAELPQASKQMSQRIGSSSLLSAVLLIGILNDFLKCLQEPIAGGE